MLLGIAAAFTVAATAPVATLKPLREVVYHATYSRRSNHVQEVYGGNRPDPYGSSIRVTSDSGTITVDVIAVADDGIALSVTEQFGNPGRPQTTPVVVLPDGSLNYTANDLNDATVALLPFFAAKFVSAQQSLDVGASWIRQIAGGGYEVATKYTVQKVDGPIVTIDERRTIKNRTATGSDATVTGFVDYKPHVLCPVAGSMTERTSAVGIDFNEDVTVSLEFERVSDTNDPTK